MFTPTWKILIYGYRSALLQQLRQLLLKYPSSSSFSLLCIVLPSLVPRQPLCFTNCPPSYRVYQLFYFTGKRVRMVSYFPVTFHRTSFNRSHFTVASRWCLNFTAVSGKEMANRCFTLMLGAVCGCRVEELEQSGPGWRTLWGMQKCTLQVLCRAGVLPIFFLSPGKWNHCTCWISSCHKADRMTILQGKRYSLSEEVGGQQGRLWWLVIKAGCNIVPGNVAPELVKKAQSASEVFPVIQRQWWDFLQSRS